MNIVIEAVGLAVLVLSVAGVWFNNQMDRRCFVLWMISNGLSLALHAGCGMWAMVARDAIFLVLSVDGMRRWRKRIKN